jgi:hypothetical protein
MKKKLVMTPTAIRSRKWRAANREKAREISRKSSKKAYWANPEKKLAAGKRWREENPERVKILAKRSQRKVKKASATSYEASLNQILATVKSRAKRHKKGFNIDLDYLINLWVSQKGRCNLSNLKMTTGIGTLNSRVSVDRIDSKKGYVKGNCQLLRSDVNIAKNDLIQKDFIKLCKAVAKNYA